MIPALAHIVLLDILTCVTTAAELESFALSSFESGEWVTDGLTNERTTVFNVRPELGQELREVS
jgi:hypothetical protein